jgi:hypothetical protein
MRGLWTLILWYLELGESSRKVYWMMAGGHRC